MSVRDLGRVPLWVIHGKLSSAHQWEQLQSTGYRFHALKLKRKSSARQVFQMTQLKHTEKHYNVSLLAKIQNPNSNKSSFAQKLPHLMTKFGLVILRKIISDHLKCLLSDPVGSWIFTVSGIFFSWHKISKSYISASSISSSIFSSISSGMNSLRPPWSISLPVAPDRPSKSFFNKSVKTELHTKRN